MTHTVDVTDTGIGCKDFLVAKIFEIFFEEELVDDTVSSVGASLFSAFNAFTNHSFEKFFDENFLFRVLGLIDEFKNRFSLVLNREKNVIFS